MKRVRVEIAIVGKRYVNADMTLVERVVGDSIELQVKVYDDELIGDLTPEAVAREKVREALQKLVDAP